MGLQIEIIERSSVIVVTLTGATELGALQPLHDALRVAAGEGKTVVVDITAVTQAGALTGVIDALGPIAGTLKLVAPYSAIAGQPPADYPEIYPSVEAAISAIRLGDPSTTKLSDADLAARFDDLRERYALMIERCRQLLQDAEHPPADGVRLSIEPNSHSLPPPVTLR